MTTNIITLAMGIWLGLMPAGATYWAVDRWTRHE